MSNTLAVVTAIRAPAYDLLHADIETFGRYDNEIIKRPKLRRTKGIYTLDQVRLIGNRPASYLYSKPTRARARKQEQYPRLNIPYSAHDAHKGHTRNLFLGEIEETTNVISAVSKHAYN